MYSFFLRISRQQKKKWNESSAETMKCLAIRSALLRQLRRPKNRLRCCERSAQGRDVTVDGFTRQCFMKCLLCPKRPFWWKHCHKSCISTCLLSRTPDRPLSCHCETFETRSKTGLHKIARLACFARITCFKAS